MKIPTLVLAGTLLTAGLAASAASARPGTLREAGRASSHAGSVLAGSLGEARVRRHSFRAPQLSPHIGLPGISGLGSPGISPHIGLPGMTGLPSLSDSRRGRGRGHGHGHDDEFFDFVGYYESDGYVDTIPMADQFGFFATGGTVSQDSAGRPVYHYDRSYPYEFGGAKRTTAPTAMASIACEERIVQDTAERTESIVRVCKGN